jgi:RNA polymerase sigma-70 factor (sigma-E family)
MRARLDRDFEEFVRARSGSLLRTAMLLVGDANGAQDLLQVALWRTSRRWAHASDHPDAYVRKVLVNLAHDGRRRASRRVTESSLDDTVPGSVADRAASVVERDALVAALRRLPARQRATLVLRFWDDLSVEETATALGCATGTVKSNTSKGLAGLREILDEQAKSDVETGTVP